MGPNGFRLIFLRRVNHWGLEVDPVTPTGSKLRIHGAVPPYLHLRLMPSRAQG
jgi:hypothetical protein